MWGTGDSWSSREEAPQGKQPSRRGRGGTGDLGSKAPGQAPGVGASRPARGSGLTVSLQPPRPPFPSSPASPQPSSAPPLPTAGLFRGFGPFSGSRRGSQSGLEAGIGHRARRPSPPAQTSLRPGLCQALALWIWGTAADGGAARSPTSHTDTSKMPESGLPQDA